MSKNNIRLLRAKYDMSQEDLASKVNLTQTAVSAWENEKNLPDAQTLIQLASLFNTTTDYILGLTDGNGVVLNAIGNRAPVKQAGGNLTNGETRLSNEEIDIIEVIRQSDMERKLKILNFFIELKKESKVMEDIE